MAAKWRLTDKGWVQYDDVTGVVHEGTRTSSHSCRVTTDPQMAGCSACKDIVSQSACKLYKPASFGTCSGGTRCTHLRFEEFCDWNDFKPVDLNEVTVK